MIKSIIDAAIPSSPLLDFIARTTGSPIAMDRIDGVFDKLDTLLPIYTPLTYSVQSAPYIVSFTDPLLSYDVNVPISNYRPNTPSGLENLGTLIQSFATYLSVRLKTHVGMLTMEINPWSYDNGLGQIIPGTMQLVIQPIGGLTLALSPVMLSNLKPYRIVLNQYMDAASLARISAFAFGDAPSPFCNVSIKGYVLPIATP